MSGKKSEQVSLSIGCNPEWPLVARAQQSAMPVIGFLNKIVPAPANRRNALTGHR
jgi:hypothetical protein